MKKQMSIMLLGMFIIFGGIFGWRAYQRHLAAVAAQQSESAVTISATRAKQSTWRPKLSAVANVHAVQSVSITSELAGKIVAIDFHSSERVEAGASLVQLNDRQDRAKLRSLKAQAKLARTNYDRDKKLIKQRGVSQSELDSARSALHNMRAQVQEQAAVVAKKSIEAPFAGQLGVRLVNLGQYISPGTAIVNLQLLQPIYADFSLPQEDYNQIHRGQAVRLTVDTYPNTVFTGKVEAINPNINEQTRNFRVRAVFQNKKEKLRPGMFGDADAVLAMRRQVITLPQSAISYNPYGDMVYIVHKDDKPHHRAKFIVRQAVVETGATRGDQIEITHGVKVGQRVVTSGQLKLHDGSHVKINNSVQPPSNPSPSPAEG